ncbi:MAG: M56 family metallopeptidase [Pirellulales bacterium]
MNDSVFLWAFNVLLQVTCLSALGLGIAVLVQKHATAKYWVLCSTLLLMLASPLVAAVMQGLGASLISVEVPTSITSDEEPHARSLAPVLSHPEREESGSLRAPSEMMKEVAVVGAADSTLADDMELRVPPKIAPGSLAGDSGLYDAPQHGAFAEASNALTRVETQRGGPRASGESKLPRPWRLVAGAFVGVWLAGAAFLLARLGVNCWQVRRILNTAVANTNPRLAEVFARVGGELPLTHMPDLVLSGEVSGPVSAGLLRPRIVLPTWLIEHVSAAHLHSILVHELAHVLRRDQLTVLLQNVVGAIYWFHPLAVCLNRVLAQAREEVCDNYVLATTSAPSYSRTLLVLAQLVTPRPLPGAVGLFTSRWKLENRVAGLLDEQRCRVVDLGSGAKLLIAALSFVVATVAALGTVTLAVGENSDGTAQSERTASKKAKEDSSSNTNENALLGGPTHRGEGNNREMLLRGRVFDVDGRPARGFELVATVYKSHLGREVLPATVEGSEFEVWVPISGSHWFNLGLTATAKNGSRRAVEGVENRELRQAAIEGIDLRLAPTNRTVKISVMHDGAPVANAHVNAELSPNMLLQSKTDARGKSTFRLREGEKLSQLTAWTDDFRIGGFSFSRKPRRDPLGTEFTIELDDCRDQTIRFLNAEDNSAVANVPFELVIGTGKPNYNFAAVPASFPHCRMTTDKDGEATCRWFPDWMTHGAYVEIIDPQWATAVENNDLKTADDGALVVTLKRRVPRKPIVGKITSDRFDVGGLLVEVKSFQGEEKGHSDHVYAFTDEAGNFTADCIPGATYTVCVNDGRLLSHMIDLIPYELDTGKSNLAELKVSEGSPVEIRVTSGPRREPMRNQWLYVRQSHRYEWLKDGEKRSGQGARDYPVYTDDHGVARARALAGTELRVTVYAGEWRSEDRHVTVKEEGVTLVEIHRKFDVERQVKGQLFAPPEVHVKIAGAEIIFGSIDGETDEHLEVTADADGRFAFKTKAIELGIFAYTTDGKAAGVVKPEKLDGPIEIHLKPTMDLHGQLLDKNDEPLANHGVRVNPRVGKRDFNKSFATSFETITFETKTDANGNYTLMNLPTEIDMTLRADPIDGSEYDAYLDDFYLMIGDQRPRMVSRLDRTSKPDDRTLSEKHKSVLRDANLGGYHLLVLSYDAAAEDFVNTKLLDHEATREVMSFLNLRIEEESLTKDADRKFAESKNWPQPMQGKVFACALDATGNELGRIELDASKADAAAKAAEFLRKHAPPQADARAKWDAAFAEAKRSGRRVWAQIGQRYCGPCFRLSRWIDDNRELLQRDYVLLKIDNVRDKHGVEVANRIVSNREHFGVPFHTIFEANERLLIDSESSVGNIGHPSSYEGRRHLTKMLHETRKNLTEAEIKQIVGTLDD